MASTARSAVSTVKASSASASARLSRIPASSSQMRTRSDSGSLPRPVDAPAPPVIVPPPRPDGRSARFRAGPRPPRSRGRRLLVVPPGPQRDAVAAQLVVERLGVDAQDARDALLVPPMAL